MMTTDLAKTAYDVPVSLGLADDVIDGLRSRLQGLKADTPEGYRLVRRGIAEMRQQRVQLKVFKSELKSSALDWSLRVDVEFNRVLNLLLKIEQPLKLERAKIDNAKEIKRQEKIEAARKEAEEKQRAERERIEKEQAAAAENLAKEREEFERQKAEQEAADAKQRLFLAAAQQKIDDENDRLRWDKADRELVAKIERDAAGKQERDRIAAEEHKNEQAKWKERHDRADRELAESARLAEERKPDRQKILEFADEFMAGIKWPAVSTDWAQVLVRTTYDDLQLVIDRLKVGGCFEK